MSIIKSTYNKRVIASKNFFNTTVALIVWSITVAFILRFATAVIWYFLATSIFKNLTLPARMVDAVILVKFLLIFVVCIILLNVIWAQYNLMRFGYLDRRKHPGYSLKDKEICAASNTSLAKLKQLQRAKIVLMCQKQDQVNQYYVTQYN